MLLEMGPEVEVVEEVRKEVQDWLSQLEVEVAQIEAALATVVQRAMDLVGAVVAEVGGGRGVDKGACYERRGGKVAARVFRSSSALT